MNSDQDYLSKFINGVYYDLGEPSDYTQARLWAWFLDNANLGKLNNLIGTSVEGVVLKDTNNVATGYAIGPAPSNDQLAIYKMLFEYEYYKSQARSIATSAATIGTDWTNLREADSSITKINRNEVSRNFRTLARDAKEDLDKAVKMYLKYNAVPDQVAGDDTLGVPYYIVYEYSRILH